MKSASIRQMKRFWLIVDLKPDAISDVKVVAIMTDGELTYKDGGGKTPVPKGANGGAMNETGHAGQKRIVGDDDRDERWAGDLRPSEQMSHGRPRRYGAGVMTGSGHSWTWNITPN